MISEQEEQNQDYCESVDMSDGKPESSELFSTDNMNDEGNNACDDMFTDLNNNPKID